MRLTVRVGAVLVDVGPDKHKTLQHSERKVRTYGKALLGLASLLCLSVCSNLVCSTLSILAFKESRFSDAIPPPRTVVLSASKAAAPVGSKREMREVREMREMREMSSRPAAAPAPARRRSPSVDVCLRPHAYVDSTDSGSGSGSGSGLGSGSGSGSGLLGTAGCVPCAARASAVRVLPSYLSGGLNDRIATLVALGNLAHSLCAWLVGSLASK